MLNRTIGVICTVVVTVALVGGCAGTRAPMSDHPAAAVTPTADLSGTWYGDFGAAAGTLAFYEDEAITALRINPDGTFTATFTPNGGTGNNHAKRTTLTGTVVEDGDGVTLKTDGSWGWIPLTRSGDNTLYGLAMDPANQVPVMIRFNRAGTA